VENRAFLRASWLASPRDDSACSTSPPQFFGSQARPFTVPSMLRQSNRIIQRHARHLMTVQNNLRPTTFPPVQRQRPSGTPETTARPEAQPAESAQPALPGGLVGNHVNTTA
jgi:hypothetical protein